MLSATFYTANRRRLCERIEQNDVLVIAGNGSMQMASDTSYPFRQESNLLYLTGIEWPECTLITDVRTHKSTLLVPARDAVSVAFNGPVDISTLKLQSGVDDILVGKQADAYLNQAVVGSRVGAIKPPRSYVSELYTNPFRAKVWRRLQRLRPSNIVDIREHLIALRSVKQAEEIAAIDAAARLTIKACAAVESELHTIDAENQAAAIISALFLHNGSEHAFPPIIAAGPNTCALHYEANKAPKNSTDILLLDIGARVSGYSADIARTYLPSDATHRQREVYAAVAQAQQHCIELLKPGISWRHFVMESDRIVGEQLVTLGLIDHAMDRRQIRQYFPHSVSHSLGLDTHDPIDYSGILQAGMVVTVEPGIYITDEAIGVRIEDDVLITERGARLLGR